MAAELVTFTAAPFPPPPPPAITGNATPVPEVDRAMTTPPPPPIDCATKPCAKSPVVVAYGIIAQSIGGAGGAGTADKVTVNTQANVVVSGLDSTAIFAQSVNRTGFGGNIGITVSNA